VIEEFYRGKTITIVVGSSAGGGFDVYGRLVGRHLAKHIPGDPTIIVENRPGAGSLIAANSVYQTAPRDGTVIVHFIGAQIIQQLLGNPEVQFDARQYNWLGAPTKDTIACYARTDSGFDTLAQATGSRQLIMGGEAPGSAIDDALNIVRVVGGLNIRIVSGYKGSGEILLAIEKNEVMGTCLGWGGGSAKPLKEAIEAGKLRVLAQGVKTPHRELPNVPLMRDLARDDQGRQMVDVGITYPNELLRPFAFPPGVPAVRVQALREALAATFRDPEFSADADRAQLERAPISGEDFATMVTDAFSISPEMVAKLKAAYAGD
jgi:tripartite-type tricarboxylate transporter receptor subunit TctC